jgi:hypothetical protein
LTRPTGRFASGAPSTPLRALPPQPVTLTLLTPGEREAELYLTFERPAAAGCDVSGLGGPGPATADALLGGAGRRADVVLLDLELGDGTTPERNVAAIRAAGPAVLVLSPKWTCTIEP